MDAPVSGGTVGAEEATLAIMVGGKQKVFDDNKEVLKAMKEGTLTEAAERKSTEQARASQINEQYEFDPRWQFISAFEGSRRRHQHWGGIPTRFHQDIELVTRPTLPHTSP